MPIFQNATARLHAWLFPDGDVIFTVRTRPRIAHFVLPIVEKLIGDDKVGETYRCAVAFWHRWNEPPLTIFQGTVSLCRIDGPLTKKKETYRPAGGLVETAGLTARLPSDEAHDLDQRLRAAIEKTIRDWAEERGARPQPVTNKTNRGQRKIASEHKGAENV
jgi:hypothetical protein